MWEEASPADAVREQKSTLLPHQTACRVQEPPTLSGSSAFGIACVWPCSFSVPPGQPSVRSHRTWSRSWICVFPISWPQTGLAGTEGPQMFRGWLVQDIVLPRTKLSVQYRQRKLLCDDKHHWEFDISNEDQGKLIHARVFLVVKTELQKRVLDLLDLLPLQLLQRSNSLLHVRSAAEGLMPRGLLGYQRRKLQTCFNFCQAFSRKPLLNSACMGYERRKKQGTRTYLEISTRLHLLCLRPTFCFIKGIRCDRKEKQWNLEKEREDCPNFKQRRVERKKTR